MARLLILLAIISFTVVSSRCRSGDRQNRAAKADDKIVITRNYTAEWNAPTLAVPEEERAWTYYRQAAIEFADVPTELDEANWPVAYDHSLFDKAVEHLKLNTAVMDDVRQASRLPHLGVLLAQPSDPVFGRAMALKYQYDYE